jgi:hypothetical protein
MNSLPQSDTAYVLRTSFSDAPAWAEIRRAIEAPVDGFLAYVSFVDDPAYDGATKQQVMDLFLHQPNHSFVIVADAVAMTDADHPLLIIDLRREPGREFRAIPSAVQAIENNLSISNMDFVEFAECVDTDGIFRSFPP